MKKEFFAQIIFAISVLGLVLTLRGNPGNPTVSELNTPHWKEDGPLELSPESGRFGLTYSLLEDKSVHFSVDLARFITPDVGYTNRKYVSLFAPGVSFLAAPGYILGSWFNLAQVGAFATIAIFAILNALLIKSIATRLGANNLAASLASLVFLFATPAFTYAVSLYQHHISTFLILFAIYFLLRTSSLLSLAVIWFLCAASIPIDYPNLILMFPIAILALKRLINLKFEKKQLNLEIIPTRILTLAAVLIPLFFFMWFNQVSYGNPLQFSGTVQSAEEIDENGLPSKKNQNSREPIPEAKSEKSSIAFFQTRNMITGVYTHLASPDRGILFYSPILILALAGIFLTKNKNPIITTLIAIAAVNLVLYSMWGDPYGGWAFGSRYLIPAYSILAIFMAIVLTNFAKNKFILAAFLLLSIYSILVNTLGAITSSRNPPKVEATALSQISGRRELYTPQRNLEYLLSSGSKSLIFRSVLANSISASLYYLFVSALLIGAFSTLTLVFFWQTRRRKNEAYI